MKPEEIAALEYVLKDFEPNWPTHEMSCWNIIRRMLEEDKKEKEYNKP